MFDSTSRPVINTHRKKLKIDFVPVTLTLKLKLSKLERGLLKLTLNTLLRVPCAPVLNCMTMLIV